MQTNGGLAADFLEPRNRKSFVYNERSMAQRVLIKVA